MRIIASCVASVLAAAAAASAQAPLPAEVDQAIALAESRAEPEQRWAFTRATSVNGSTLIARYDPARPAGAEWTLIEPASEQALTDEQRGLFDNLRNEETPDRRLMIERSEESFGLRVYVRQALALAERNAAQLRFSFQPVDGVGLTFSAPEGGPQLAEHLLGELLVAASEPALQGLRIFAPESFKPAAAARLNRLDIAWRFGEAEPGGPIAIVGSHTELEGSALFRGFATVVDVVNSDFARVEAAE